MNWMPARRPLAVRIVGPEPDRVDAHAPRGGLRGRLDRQRPGVARAVGQQHDDRRRVRAARERGWRLRIGRRTGIGLDGRDAVVDLGDRVERFEDRAADRRPPTRRQALDDVEQHLLVGRRRLDDLGEPGERDDADLGGRVWRSMNDDAAASAASSRFGGMSVAHMLRETSIARMTVVRPAGTLTTWTGRAIATTRLTSPSANSANGRWRRIRDDPPTASRTSDRLE